MITTEKIEYIPRVCFTVENLKQANKDAGQNWFSPETMRYWHSRVNRMLTHNEDGDTYFISSEHSFHGDRLYTIRCLRYATGHVDTVSEFQQYTTLAQAKAAMKFIAGR